MCTMKEACDQVGITYETLRFYCNEGLVPNVRRDKNNYRDFDERNIAWLKSLQCLKKCGMGIKDMKTYMNLCLQGVSSIPQRQAMLARNRELLQARIREIDESIEFIDGKQAFFEGVLAGEVAYKSNLLQVEET